MTASEAAAESDCDKGNPATVFAAAVAAAAGTVVARRLTARLPVAAARRWERTNHAGLPVTLLEGPIWVGGAVTGLAVRSTTRSRRPAARDPRRSVAPALLALVGSGALGALDDLMGSAASKGLKGHWGALRRGQVTTGAIKVVGLAATGVAAAFLVDRNEPRRPVGAGAALESLVGGAVIAGAANAANLFDLRPGRALKVVLACAAPLALSGSASAATALGATGGVLRDDLAGRSMLGDTGANASGALVGLALVESTRLRGRLLALAALTALTLASERVSFTQLIEGSRTLRRLDEWGRTGR